MNNQDFCANSNIRFMPANPVLATAYVPFQQYSEIYSPYQGLAKGTIFPDLVREYATEANTINTVNEKMS